MTETGLQNLIRLELSKLGVVFRRQSGKFLTRDGKREVTVGVPGEADLEFVGRGFVAFIEVKLPDGSVTPEQNNFLEHMKALGHRAGVARSVRDAFDIIEGGK